MVGTHEAYAVAHESAGKPPIGDFADHMGSLATVIGRFLNRPQAGANPAHSTSPSGLKYTVSLVALSSVAAKGASRSVHIPGAVGAPPRGLHTPKEAMQMIDERLAQIQADLMACRCTPYDRTSREQRIIIEHVPWLLRQLRSTQAYAEMWRQRCLLLAAGQSAEGDDGGRKAVVDENRRASQSRVSESALEAARDARGA